MKNRTASTGATIENLAKKCNEFFVKDSIRYLIDDLVYWVCDKPNPHFFKKQDRRNRPGAGVKPLIKAVLRLHHVGSDGRFTYENQVTDNGWILTNKREIDRLAGGVLTEDMYRYAKDVLIAKEILQVDCRRKTFGCWVSKLYIRVNFDKLQEILTNLPELRKLMPESHQVPAPKPGSVLFGLNPECSFIKGASSLAPAAVDTGIASPGNIAMSSPSGSLGELSASAEGSPSKKFEDEVFTGDLDVEGEMIITNIRQEYGCGRTNALVRKVQALRHLKSSQNMTIDRVHEFFHLICNLPSALPKWMNNLELDQFLNRNFWRKIVLELNRWEVRGAADAQFTLDNDFDEDREDLIKSLKLLERDPEAFWQDILSTRRLQQSHPWLMYFAYGMKQHWNEQVMAPIRIRVRRMLQRNPTFFCTTRDLVDWVQLLNLTIEEVYEMTTEAEKQLRSLRWQVHLGEQYGTV